MKNALQSIRAFVTVAHAGHFAKAAAQLHLSPSALTVQVQQLEQWLGVALLDRGPRHLELTEAGRQNLPQMEQLLLDLDNLVASNRDLAALRRGTVELAALPSLCSSLLPVALKHFGHLHPGIEVRLRDVVAQQVEDQVRAGSVDFGLSVAPRSAGGLRFEPLLVDRICLLLPLDHPLNDGRPLTVAHLDAQPMILTGRDSSVRMQVERLFEDRHLRLHRQIEANYMSTAIALVQQGLGMTLLPESAVQGHETLACIPLEEPALNRCIGIITRSERALGPAAEALAELLSTHAAGAGA